MSATHDVASVFSAASPGTGAPLEPVEATPAEAVAGIARRARAAQESWRVTTHAERAKALRAAKARMLARAEEIARVVALETGKPEVEALLGEVLPSADVVDYWLDAAPDLLAPEEAEIDAVTYPKKAGFVHREPRGVVAAIMPWNFPFSLPLRTIVPALVSGNAVVLKPSELTPRAAALIASLFDGLLPDGLLALVQGGGAAGAALCAAEVDYVVFTGSPASGRKVAHACAERLLPCALELGGKDAAIVLADADLERAANGVVWGAMMNAGQNCGAVERVYVEASVLKAFEEKVVAATKALRIGADVGPLTSAAQRRIVEEHVADARARGAEVLVGGEAVTDAAAQLGYAPTVVRVADDDAALVREETFGPVLPLTEVPDVEVAIARANASRYGLTASVWTRDVARGEAIARRLRAGVVTVNNHGFTGAIASLPWGGVGESGWGVTGSRHALEHFTRPKAIVVDRSRARRESWWYPYTPALRAMALALASLRGGASSVGDRARAVFALLSALPKRMKELGSGRPE